MSTVQELGALHRRYSDTSHRFRAAWTFHQFLQSLGKGNVPPATADAHSASFHNVYTELKEISQSLNVTESDRLQGRLDALDRRLTKMIEELDEEDGKVEPYVLRQFFRRVKTYDEKILTQLVKFYLYTQRGDLWASDRLDKIDFLLARLSEEEDDRTGEPRLRDLHRLREVFFGLWAMLGIEPPARSFLEENKAAIDATRQQVVGLESLDQLNEGGLIRQYREFKHGLGNYFFEPTLLVGIQETNLALKNRIRTLYNKEERRIVAEYQRVFELEREVPLDRELDIELARFREEIEAFEGQLQSKEFKLEDLAQIRQRVRDLVPRLTAASRGHLASSGAMPKGNPNPASDYLTAAAEDVVESPLAAQEDLLGEYYRRLVEALREVGTELSPERVILTPEIFPFRIEPREVTAYRRLFGRAECDRELEQFVLEGAALRMRINEEAQEIASILDETSVTGDSIVYARARWTARTANLYLWRFAHVLDESVLAGGVTEGRQLQLLRMRLMRDYSGLWLLAYKPLLKRNPGGTIA
jgi:hypothetical protein